MQASKIPYLKPLSPSEPSLGSLVHDLARLLRRNFNRRAQDLGLTQAQWRALAYLSRNEGINQACLAEHLDVQPISTARLIDRMQASGWVERRPDPQDRRAVRLYLTEKAQPLLARIWSLAAQTQAEALAGLSEDRYRRLMQALGCIKRNLVEAEANTNSVADKK